MLDLFFHIYYNGEFEFSGGINHVVREKSFIHF